jgi:hypothetical protein
MFSKERIVAEEERIFVGRMTTISYPTLWPDLDPSTPRNLARTEI